MKSLIWKTQQIYLNIKTKDKTKNIFLAILYKILMYCFVCKSSKHQLDGRIDSCIHNKETLIKIIKHSSIDK
jgi:hypothetical protein